MIDRGSVLSRCVCNPEVALCRRCIESHTLYIDWWLMHVGATHKHAPRECTTRTSPVNSTSCFTITFGTVGCGNFMFGVRSFRKAQSFHKVFANRELVYRWSVLRFEAGGINARSPPFAFYTDLVLVLWVLFSVYRARAKTTAAAAAADITNWSG